MGRWRFWRWGEALSLAGEEAVLAQAYALRALPRDDALRGLPPPAPSGPPPRVF